VDDTRAALLLDYSQAAEKLERGTFNPTRVAFWAAAASIALGVWLIVSPINQGVGNGGIVALSCFGGGVTIVPLFAYWVAKNVYDGRVAGKARRLDAQKPGFQRFYTAWKKERSMSTGDWLTLGIGVAGVASSSYSEYKLNRALDDVHAIRKSIDG
jgi:hypothetical protein